MRQQVRLVPYFPPQSVQADAIVPRSAQIVVASLDGVAALDALVDVVVSVPRFLQVVAVLEVAVALDVVVDDVMTHYLFRTIRSGRNSETIDSS